MQTSPILLLQAMSSCILLNLSVKLSSVLHLISARQCFSQVLWMVASDCVNKRAFFWMSMNHCPVMLETDHCSIKRLAKALRIHTLNQHVPMREIYVFRAAQSRMIYSERERDHFSCSLWTTPMKLLSGYLNFKQHLAAGGECLISLSPLVVLGFCIFQ